MESPSPRDLRSAAPLVRALHRRSGGAPFTPQILDGLGRLVGADHVSYNEVDRRRGTFLAVVHPAGADEFPGNREIFARGVGEHPFVVNAGHLQQGGAYRVSDLVSRREFHRLPIYNEYYRRIGIEHQAAVALRAPRGLVAGVAFNRGGARDFSGRERALLDWLAPHVRLAHENALAVRDLTRRAALFERGLGSLGVGVLLLGAKGDVRFASAEARAWLSTYFGDARRRGCWLPDALARWVRERSSASAEGVAAGFGHLAVGGDGRRLEIRMISSGDERALLMRERLTAPAPAALALLGLSKRETEVLTCLVHGAGNATIALQLGARPRTVAKHLERIYTKLGVETRTGAVALALGLLGA